MPALRIKLREITFHILDCHTRLPFRFGIHTLTGAPLCLARVIIENPDGRAAEGFASDLLVPKWFEKRPDQTIHDDWRRLIQSAKAAAGAALESSAHAPVFDHWRRLHHARVSGAPRGEQLLRGQGVSLIERALIDGACRAAAIPFFRALRDDLLGFRPSEVAPDLAGWALSASLSGRPADHIHLRHTVGLLDALRTSDIPAHARVHDGLPESLEEDIARAGLTYFKLKLSGRSEPDLERLLAVAAVIFEQVPEPSITIDGNEQFASIADLVALLEKVQARDLGRRLISRLILIEQPLSRAETFNPAAVAGIEALSRLAPCIIDEADAELDALPRAAALGYGGVSIKNCKGVFRALVNFGRCARSGGRLVQSAEDLTNLPVVALQQDLATVTALGLTHVERNGHHYFRGLRHLPPGLRRAARAAHPDLYDGPPDDPFLHIDRGLISTRSLHDSSGYAYNLPLALDEHIPIDQWIPPA